MPPSTDLEYVTVSRRAPPWQGITLIKKGTSSRFFKKEEVPLETKGTKIPRATSQEDAPL